MRRYALNILTVFLLLILTICDTALAEERQVYAAQGDVAFFKENGKIGLQATDGNVLHAAEFDGVGYFDATQQANIYVDDGSAISSSPIVKMTCGALLIMNAMSLCPRSGPQHLL